VCSSYLVDILVLKLRDELVESLIIRVDADRGEDALDIRGRWAGVASKAEEEICREVLHFLSACQSLPVLSPILALTFDLVEGCEQENNQFKRLVADWSSGSRSKFVVMKSSSQTGTSAREAPLCANSWQHRAKPKIL